MFEDPRSLNSVFILTLAEASQLCSYVILSCPTAIPSFKPTSSARSMLHLFTWQQTDSRRPHQFQNILTVLLPGPPHHKHENPLEGKDVLSVNEASMQVNFNFKRTNSQCSIPAALNRAISQGFIIPFIKLGWVLKKHGLVCLMEHNEMVKVADAF